MSPGAELTCITAVNFMANVSEAQGPCCAVVVTDEHCSGVSTHSVIHHNKKKSIVDKVSESNNHGHMLLKKNPLKAALQTQGTLLKKENKPLCSVLQSAAVISGKTTQCDSVKSFVFF